MLLAVDVGNTQTVLGLYEGDRLADDWRLATERTRTGDELGVLLGGMLDLDAVDGICLASTVPTLVREWERLAERWADAPLLVVGPGVKTGIPIRYDDPREVGPDRIVNSVAAKERYGAPGDRRRLRHLDELRRRVSAQGEYVGGVLAPGSRPRWRRSSPVRPGSSRSTTRSRRGDREDDGRRAAVRPRVRLRRSGGRHRDRDPGRARAPTHRSSRRAAWPDSSRRTRSTIGSVDPFLTLDGLRLVWELNSS